MERISYYKEFLLTFWAILALPAEANHVELPNPRNPHDVFGSMEMDS